MKSNWFQEPWGTKSHFALDLGRLSGKAVLQAEKDCLILL